MQAHGRTADDRLAEYDPGQVFEVCIGVTA